MTLRLSELHPGQTGHVLRLDTEGSLRQRLLDLGLVPGTAIEQIMHSPIGDPICYRVRGAMIALRQQDARNIQITI
ncbi:MAG: hypothetical protein HJJLKODD_02808 [Phycisphaerae bacterium]|nr:hypothetical protein [Phycisphaerae bacterium]